MNKVSCTFRLVLNIEYDEPTHIRRRQGGGKRTSKGYGTTTNFLLSLRLHVLPEIVVVYFRPFSTLKETVFASPPCRMLCQVGISVSTCEQWTYTAEVNSGVWMTVHLLNPRSPSPFYQGVLVSFICFIYG